MIKPSVLLFTLLIISGCKFLISQFDSDEVVVIGPKSDSFSIVFSGNVNGETHPCGCRHFPLGGLPQVAGQVEKIKKNNDLIIVDAGDTFFASSKIPESLKKSLSYTAENLARGLSKLGMIAHVPGDQDFAGGVKYYSKLTNGNKISPLISNLKDPKTFPHKKFIVIEKGPHKIFITGVVSPSVLTGPFRNLFNDPIETLKNLKKELADKGLDFKSKFHRFIVISHAGMEFDKKMAREVKDIDWIIGSHSQSFIRVPVEEGTTKLVQVLSRNHYLGEVKISLKSDKSKDSYMIHEIRDELKDELKPNEFLSFIDKHKEEVSKIQEEEQNSMSDFSQDSVQKLASASTCIECHEAQANKWLSTAHSMAYHTLIKSKEEKNLACVKCHSVGLGKEEGFITVKGIVLFDSQLKDKELEGHRENYWKEVTKAFSGIKSVRSLSSKQLKKHSKQWLKIDEKFKVAHNFSNVQCLNCHSQAPDHPFAIGEKDKYSNSMESYEKRCLECHDADQSPSWYKKNDVGIPTEIDKFVLQKMIKKVACPKNQ